MGTLILRPNAAGDVTGITVQYPNSTFHWDKVDEAVADDNSTLVSCDPEGDEYDLYNLPAHTDETGAVNSIKIYFRCYRQNGKASPKLKTGGTEYTGTEVTVTSTWTTYSQTWATNPKTGVAWTWADIDALQIGIRIKGVIVSATSCTQVYVEVDYVSGVLLTLTETSTFTDTLGRLITKALTETATFTDTLGRLITKALTETATFTDTLGRLITKALTEVVTFYDSLNLGQLKVLTETVTYTVLMELRRRISPTRILDAIRNQLAKRNESSTREET
jgi:phage-related holin